MSWRLRYAPHLGFRSLEQPLFLASAGSADPIAQIDFAASCGFAGVQDPWFATRERDVQDRIAARLRERGLAAGCVVCGTPASIRTPLWTRGGEPLGQALDAALDAARRIGARQIAVLTGFEADAPRADQLARLTDNLSRAAPRVAREGLTLCLEPTNARTLPNMLLAHFDEACALVRGLGHPAVRMIFDTAHIQSMDGDLLGRLERDFDLIDVAQIANHPGRTEPQVGEIQMVAVLAKLYALGFSGLVELEHIWERPGLEAERRALDWLARADAGLGDAEGAA